MFSVSLDTNPLDSPITFREVTVNPFVMSHNLVDMWCEIVMTNDGSEPCQPPDISLHFSHPVLVQSRSHRCATPYLSRMSRADMPSQLLDYLPTRDLNEAMYSELWFSFLDLALPRRAFRIGKTSDLFSHLYTEPLRLVQNIDIFLNQINHLMLARCGPRPTWSILSRTGNTYIISLTHDESLSFSIQVDPLADGTCVFKRAPWKATKDESVRCFPTTPRIAVLDNEAHWLVRPYVQRRSGNYINPGEGIMFWFWWRHVQPFAEGIIHSASPFTNEFVLSYQVKAEGRYTKPRYNTFLRCSPQLSVTGEAARGGASFAPVPVTSEIFSEWAWYTEQIDRWLYRFAREGASQYEISTAGGPERSDLTVTATFSDTHAEQARLSRLLLLTSIFLGVLTEFFAAAVWSWRGSAPSGMAITYDAHVAGVIIFSILLGFIVLIRSLLEYQRFTSNPILVHDLTRYAQTWLRLRGFSIADDEHFFRWVRRLRTTWNCFVILSVVTFGGMVWGYAVQEEISDTWLLCALLILGVLWLRTQFTHRRRIS